MKTAVISGVIALTLTAMEPLALADETPTTPTSTPTQTPLATRPVRPLALAPANEGTPFGYKLLAGVGVMVATVLWFRKRQKRQAQPMKKSRIDILGRASFGVRSELVVVDVEGTRLLVGMTPSSMQTLAVLETPEMGVDDAKDVSSSPIAEASAAAAAAAAAADVDSVSISSPASAPRRRPFSLVDDDDDVEPASALSERVRTLLAARRQALTAPTSDGSKLTTPAKSPRGQRKLGAVPKTPRVAGQARGLLLALEESATEEKLKESARAGGS